MTTAQNPRKSADRKKKEMKKKGKKRKKEEEEQTKTKRRIEDGENKLMSDGTWSQVCARVKEMCGLWYWGSLWSNMDMNTKE